MGASRARSRLKGRVARWRGATGCRLILRRHWLPFISLRGASGPSHSLEDPLVVPRGRISRIHMKILWWYRRGDALAGAGDVVASFARARADLQGTPGLQATVRAYEAVRAVACNGRPTCSAAIER